MPEWSNLPPKRVKHAFVLIQINVDELSFNGTAIKSGPIWPVSFETDTLRVDFTIKNNSQTPITDCTLTADVFDVGEGDTPVAVLTTGPLPANETDSSDFLLPRSTVGLPIAPGQSATGNLTMKWGNWRPEEIPPVSVPQFQPVPITPQVQVVAPQQPVFIPTSH